MIEGDESAFLGRWVHWSLLSGLVLSGLLLVAGLGLALVGGQPRPQGPPPSLVTCLRAASRGEAVALIDLGLLVLMTTPVLRVVVLVIGWGSARRWRFAVVALTVLGLLGLSLALGLG